MHIFDSHNHLYKILRPNSYYNTSTKSPQKGGKIALSCTWINKVNNRKLLKITKATLQDMWQNFMSQHDLLFFFGYQGNKVFCLSFKTSFVHFKDTFQLKYECYARDNFLIIYHSIPIIRISENFLKKKLELYKVPHIECRQNNETVEKQKQHEMMFNEHYNVSLQDWQYTYEYVLC